MKVKWNVYGIKMVSKKYINYKLEKMDNKQELEDLYCAIKKINYQASNVIKELNI